MPVLGVPLIESSSDTALQAFTARCSVHTRMHCSDYDSAGARADLLLLCGLPCIKKAPQHCKEVRQINVLCSNQWLAHCSPIAVVPNKLEPMGCASICKDHTTCLTCCSVLKGEGNVVASTAGSSGRHLLLDDKLKPALAAQGGWAPFNEEGGQVSRQQQYTSAASAGCLCV